MPIRGAAARSLAAVKRQAELIDSAERGKLKASGRGYHVDDLPIISMIAIGAALIVVVFPLYFCRCNRCPRCRHSFSAAEAFRDEETNGLPLFNDIDDCPFCGLDLDSRRYF